MTSVLVVEDERAIADAVVSRLRSEGFEARSVEDGAHAVELCRQLRPDLVVLDLMLPGLDGLEVCRPELARAFNAMAAELAEVDRMRKDLVANVSHELRTPISALQARLENLVDGVEDPAPDLLRSLLDQNALLHGPPDRPVRLVASGSGGAVLLTVTDEGPGIPEAEAERVFERFYRADSARAGTSGGAGLGLAIARWIVDLHGGDIRATPNRPTGCAMVIRLPAPAGARP